MCLCTIGVQDPIGPPHYLMMEASYNKNQPCYCTTIIVMNAVVKFDIMRCFARLDLTKLHNHLFLHQQHNVLLCRSHTAEHAMSNKAQILRYVKLLMHKGGLHGSNFTWLICKNSHVESSDCHLLSCWPDWSGWGLTSLTPWSKKVYQLYQQSTPARSRSSDLFSWTWMTDNPAELLN